nr:plastocyanin/azurin family copper-binding protein [Ramlibacter cellulosilyticus]
MGAAAAAWLVPVLAAAGTHVVTIEGMVFHPASIEVKPGDQVVWRNKDVVPHTATAKGVFDSGSIAPGKSWTWKAKGKGRHGYVCVYHPGMIGTVSVP